MVSDGKGVDIVDPFSYFSGAYQIRNVMQLKEAFLRTLPVGQRFYSSDHVKFTVVAPGTLIVMCRDAQFNLVWELDGGAIVKAIR